MTTHTRVFLVFMFTLQVYHFSGAAKTLIITNNCSYTVWPVVTATVGTVSNNDSGFALLDSKSRVVVAPTSWSGRVWGRTFCTTDKSTGNFSCLTGDCSTGKIQCVGSSGPVQLQPATLAEFTFAQVNNIDDYYDTSVIDGYNLPVMIAPNVDSGDSCPVTGCVFDDIGSCPTVLKMRQKAPNDNSSTIGCRGPCDVFKTNQYCCNTGNCKPTNFSKIFKSHCPRAYSYPFDNTSSTFTCAGSRASSYHITFCPSSTMSRLLSTPPSQEIQAAPPPPPPLPMSTPGPSPSSTTVVSPVPLSPASNSTTNHPHQNSSSDSKKKLHTSLIVALPTTAAILILVFLGICIFNRRRKAVRKRNVHKNEDSLQFEFSKIRLATRNFAAENKLGEGGFGEVYRGNLESGQEIAVKRLSDSKNSVQGIAEFETEIVLVAKLQHKNLVQLLGYCATPKERLLVYEFLPNSSLDKFLMDPAKKSSLNWQTRFKIIIGIAKGLLYLHEDSRIKVVHRDLKSSNILLDDEMNPKIADFGLARLFGSEQTQDDTSRIAGTYGYMAPEYARTGHYSVKSDVYSYGVIVLEIVSGQMNRLFGRVQLDEALLHRAWRHWNENDAMKLVDPMLGDDIKREEVLKCIQIGLLCVHEKAVDRPKMTSIVSSLNGQDISNLPPPKPPPFFGIADGRTPDVVDGYVASAPNVYTGTEIITDVYSRD